MPRSAVDIAQEDISQQESLRRQTIAYIEQRFPQIANQVKYNEYEIRELMRGQQMYFGRQPDAVILPVLTEPRFDREIKIPDTTDRVGGIGWYVFPKYKELDVMRVGFGSFSIYDYGEGRYWYRLNDSQYSMNQNAVTVGSPFASFQGYRSAVNIAQDLVKSARLLKTKDFDLNVDLAVAARTASFDAYVKRNKSFK